MKSVIIIDASPMFQEFLKDKLSDEGVSVTVAQGERDAFTKLLATLPDLIIMDIENNLAVTLDFLQRKIKDPNAKSIPVIMAGPSLEKNQIVNFMQFGVIKYFTKPIKFDIFFEAIGRVLRMAFSMDVTPCMLDLHRNGDLIFIEVAQNLNREKISLLKFKLSEMIENGNLSEPKIILMMTNLNLTFVDTINLELLIDNVLSNPAVKKKNVKILSMNTFTQNLVEGHEQYAGIEVVENLPQVLNSLVDSNASANMSDLITDKVLSHSHTDDGGSIETRFHSDSGVSEEDSTSSSVMRIALVDDDNVTLGLLKPAFERTGATCDTYASGSEFLAGMKKFRYDLVVLDIFMPGISGLDILKRMQVEIDVPPVLIYSQATQRESVIQALSLGAKKFLIKPQKPEVLVKTALELLRSV